MNRINTLSVALLATVAPFSTQAASELEPVIVTANRTAQTVDEALSSVTIINREQIERSSANSLPELISGTVGIDVVSSGGYGKSSSIFIRGTESKHVLLLIDGVRFHDAIEANGKANFQYLPLDIIERIEIVRGPKASLYGSDAIGGVIQVFTNTSRRGQYASAGIGSNNSSRIKAGISGANNQLSYSFRASQFQTDGISAKADNTENDGYINTSVSAQGDYKISNNSTIGITTHHTSGETEYDCSNSNNCRTDFTQSTIDSYWKENIQDNWRTEVHIGESRHERLSKLDATGDYIATTRTASWLNHIDINRQHSLVTGIDYIYDEATKEWAGSIDWNRESYALFGSLSAYLENNSQYTIGMRHEDNQQFGTHLTGDLAYEWLLENGSSVRASYGEAFKAPTLYNLYSQYGSGSLVPETSKTVALSTTIKNFTLSIFNTKIDNLILYNDFTYTYENKSADIDGLEIEFNTHIQGWDIFPALTLLNPVDRTSNKQLKSRSKQTLKVKGNKKIGSTSVEINWLTQSHRYSYQDAYTAGYGKLDLQLSHPLNKQVTLNAKAGNLLDQHYQLNSGYNTEGRNLFFSLNYRM